MKGFINSVRYIAVWGLLVASLGFQGFAHAGNGDFNRIFIFGDSLSDPGNIYALTMGQTSQAPYLLIPDRPYDFDGFQFSNGKTWAQWFARHLEEKRSGQAALTAPGINGNYAFGGSRVGSTDPGDPISASSQLSYYFIDHGYTADPEALYVIQFGGNDIRDALGVLMMSEAPDFAAAQAVVENAVSTELGIIYQLYELGARRFLVVNVPNVSLAPAIKLFGSQAVIATNLLTGGFNAGLETGLQYLEALPGMSIDRFDLHAFSSTIIADPQEYGIDNVESPCLMFLTTENAVCDKPNKYFFFDGIHPTARIHKLLSEQAASIYD